MFDSATDRYLYSYLLVTGEGSLGKKTCYEIKSRYLSNLLHCCSKPCPHKESESTEVIVSSSVLTSGRFLTNLQAVMTVFSL